MKRIPILLFILMTQLCLYPAFAQDVQSPAAGDNTETTSVMNQYFGALTNGDTATLKTLLGGNLLKKRSSLLDNPEYAGYLSTTYINATFEILNFDVTNPDVIRVNVQITFNQDERIQKQYTLTKSPSRGGVSTYRIVSERSVAGAL